MTPPIEAQSALADEVRSFHFHALPDPVLVTDAESRYLDANAAALSLLGYTLAELRNLTVNDIVVHGPEWTATELSRLLKDGVWEGRVVVRARDQTLVVVEARATVVRLPDRTECLTVLHEKKTPVVAPPPRAKAKILIVDDEPANRKLLADLVVREGYEAVVASGGAEALAILANVQVDLVLLDLMMPRVDGMAVLAELQKQQMLPALPVVVVTAHDERKVRIDALTAGAIDFIAKPIDRLEVVCRLRSLVELRHLRERAVATVEGKLRESDHLLQLRFAQSPVAQVVTDTGFRVIDWNPAAEALFGYTYAEALGHRPGFLVPEDARGRVEAVWQELLSGRANELTNENITKDGRTIQCEWHNAPITSADGKILGVSSFVLDVTERMRLKATLAQSQKMDAMGQLAGGVAHDFNNILAVILAYGSFVRDALPEGDERRDDLNEVLKAADRAVGLTKQLLAFTRQQPTEKRRVDLNQSLTELHKLLVRTLGAQVELHVLPSARPAVVRIDPVQFDQIVLNLVVNARDAMPAGGQLRVTLEHASEDRSGSTDEGWVHLKVSDSGTGMDDEIRERIFEPFFTTKEKGKGTGLGLATCFGIVADAGGRIDVKSTLGQGTTFTVELPLSSEAADSPVGDSARVSRAGRGENVVVADDDPALRKVMARVLASAGYTVHVAADGNEAIKMVDKLGARLDIVVSDVVMPGRSGYDVAEHAKRVAPGAAVVLTSGFVEDAARPDAAQDLRILWKPVRPKDLVRAVDETLRSRPTMGAAPAANRVLVVEDEKLLSKVIVRILERAGYAAETAGSIDEARRVLETGPEPLFVLCDLTLPDGSGAELLDWIQDTRPHLCPRVFVLTGGAIDGAGRRVTTSGVFRVLHKPIEPRQLVEVLAKEAKASGPAPSTTAPSPTPVPTRPPTTGTGGGIRRERVLLVDDDQSLAFASRRLLRDEFDVVLADTVAAARAVLADEALDALVVDVGLPDGSGLDLLGELRGRNSELPVVMMTGALTNEAAAQAFRSRVSAYLPKPFPLEDLLPTVRTAVEAGRVARVRTKLLAARFGGDEFVKDLPGTEKSFARALPKIRMVFQPIVRAGDGSVFGYEALLRCDEPTLATPLRLLAAAEVLGRVDDVGRAVRSGVAAAIAGERTRLEAIFVNLHPAEVRADLLAEVSDPLLALASRVVLEVTERASLEAGPKLNTELSRIRELGYRLAVDDLGEGYAGLSSLVHLRPDIAKIDMSLVRDVHRMPLKRDIVAALVDMARRSGIVVVAEGVETVDERDTLVDLGCDLLQGYLFAKPGPPFPVARTTFERVEGG
jgi:hypothetical protein